MRKSYRVKRDGKLDFNGSLVLYAEIEYLNSGVKLELEYRKYRKLSAKLEGIDIPAGLRLPELEMVLKDAAEVPLKILPECIWALEWFIRALTDGSELQVRIRPYSSSSVCESSSVLHVVKRAIQSCLASILNGSGISKPELDEPLEALRHLRAAIDADQEQVGVAYSSCTPLLLPGQEKKAKETLSRIINIDKGSQGMIFLVKSKIYLFQVLRRLGEEEDAQSHEQWLIKWLKKNPHRLPDSTPVEIFTSDTNIKEDPILTGLGGEKWLNNRRHTHKTDPRGLIREAYKLVSSELRARSFFLMGHISYREHATELKRIENQAPHKAHLASDWYTWRVAPVPANIVCVAHALGFIAIPHGPAHISFSSKLNTFPVLKSAKINSRSISNIEAAMALNKGVGKKYIKEMFEEFDHSFGKDILPMLDLMFGAGEEISKAQMEGYTYDPNWKDSLNSGNEPIESPKLPRASVQDSEKIF
ncbi:hypothetical protein GG344DRAFT_64663 [Lentinula edodes]|nr:hypothetical protein GG344DRAFT_64663 [Lentinula edodes]